MKTANIKNIVKKHIDLWDPMVLLAGGAPEDEYESEISSIVESLSTIKKPPELVDTIECVFNDAFDTVLDPEECQVIAGSIWKMMDRF